MGIVIALIIFGMIVMVHEFGHFICAKLSGIKVLEFSIGMGPQLLHKRKGETVYSVRAFPVGGYCAMEGEDSSNEDSRSFRNAKLWKRVIVLAAGAAMNFILGFLMIIIMSSLFDAIPTTQVRGFSGVRNEDNSITYYSKSYKTGLRNNDEIIEMDGVKIYSILDLNYMFETTKQSKHTLTVNREGQKLILENVEFYDEYSGNKLDFSLVTKDKTPLNIINCSGDIFMSMGHIITMSLKQLITGQVNRESVSGPVGVVSEINKATKQSATFLDAVFNMVYMAGLISINVGIFNLLPIPGLDGGRLLFCFIELVRRKPVKPEHEGYVHAAGMILLFGAMILITFKDIITLIKGG